METFISFFFFFTAKSYVLKKEKKKKTIQKKVKVKEQYQQSFYCSFTFKNSYILRQKYYPFIDGASTAARSRGKL